MSKLCDETSNKADRSHRFGAVFVRSWVILAGRLRSADHPERGDVPGWVMVTLMSALLVAALLAVAAPALTAMFNDAIQQVKR